MTKCPLPIDWLDLLEGRTSMASHAHLDECPSCRAVVNALETRPVESAAGEALLRMPADVRRGARLDQADLDAPARVEPGQMWWTIPTGDASDRLPVLVLAVFDEARRAWADVAPMWIDEGTATATDLLLDANHSTTGIGWRVVLRHQFVAERMQLDVFLGLLTLEGLALVDQARVGAIPRDRSGPELESEYDQRLAADAWIGDAARELARAYADSLEEEELDADHESLSEETAAGASTAEQGTVLPFRLDWRRRPRSDAPFRLVADTGGPSGEVLHATAEDPASGRAVEGLLSFDYLTDSVRFEVTTARGVNGPAWLVVRSDQLPEPVTVRAELAAGRMVILTSGQPVSERDVTSLELRIP